MIFWAMALFIFGVVLLLDVYSPLLGGFLQPVGPILIMLISIGMLYRICKKKHKNSQASQ